MAAACLWCVLTLVVLASSSQWPRVSCVDTLDADQRDHPSAFRDSVPKDWVGYSTLGPAALSAVRDELAPQTVRQWRLIRVADYMSGAAEVGSQLFLAAQNTNAILDTRHEIIPTSEGVSINRRSCRF